MKTMPITPTFIFPRNSPCEHADQAAPAVRLVWNYFWGLVLPTGVVYSEKGVSLRLTKYSLLRSQDGVCQAEARPGC